MAELRIDRLAALVGGTILQGPAGRTVREFGIDSRRTARGALFFAIVAQRDGHEFIHAAAAQGAAGAVVSKPVSVDNPDFALILVPDTLAALQSLAKAVLAEKPVKVVGITGSVGKTTTKEFTAALLASRFQVLKSEGNFNNHLGLALSLLRLEPGHELAVLEMGMSAAGEIRTLTRIAPPDVAVITNINPVHLEFLKTMDAITAAKKEILEGLKPDGAAVLNGDDAYVEHLAQSWSGRKIFFGLSRGCEIRADNIRRLGYDGFQLDLIYGQEQRQIRFPFVSESAISNLLAALGAARAFNLPFKTLEPALAGLRPFSKRGMLYRLADDIVLIDDSYNSNPRALEAALRGFAALPARRKIAVLGDMLELGETAPKFHAEAGAQAARFGWNVLVTVGSLARAMADGALRAGLRMSAVLSFGTSDEAAGAILGLIEAGDLVLVKGSRGIRTERIIERILDTWKES